MAISRRKNILAEIGELSKRVADDYSQEQYKHYVKEHPKTKKTPDDPMFQVKGPGKPGEGAPAQQPAPAQPAHPELKAEHVEKALHKDHGKKIHHKVLGAMKQHGREIVKHVRHEMKELGEHTHAAHKLLRGHKLEDHEKESLQTALIKSGGLILNIANGGALTEGLASILQHAVADTMIEAGAALKSHEHERMTPEEPAAPEPGHAPAAAPITHSNIHNVQFKDSGSKFKKAFQRNKERVLHYIKTKGKQYKSNAVAIKKMMTGHPITQKEMGDLKQTAKEIAVLATAAVYEHLVGVKDTEEAFATLSIMKFIVGKFAIDTLTEAAQAKHPSTYLKQKHSSEGANMDDKTDNEFIEMVMNGVFDKLNGLEKMSPEQLKQLGEEFKSSQPQAKTARDAMDELLDMLVKNIVKNLEKSTNMSPQEIKEFSKKIEQQAKHDPQFRRQIQQQLGK